MLGGPLPLSQTSAGPGTDVSGPETFYLIGKSHRACNRESFHFDPETARCAGAQGLPSDVMQMSMSVRPVCIILAFITLIPSASAIAQEPTAPSPAPRTEAELNTVNLPTTQSLGRHQSYFRITHRFSRDLRRGDFGSLLEDLFSLDNGASIGLEYRFGITSDLQAGVYRTAIDKTIQFFSRYDAWRQTGSMPVAISFTGAVEGLGNFQDDFQPAIAATVSRVAAPWLVVYASPTAVFSSRDPVTILPGAEEDGFSRHEHTLFVGLGARVRFRPTAYIVGEYSPRLAGFDPNSTVWAVGVEKATPSGKHLFQLNFTTAAGTTFGQIARGGSGHDVYLGFNIARKF